MSIIVDWNLFTSKQRNTIAGYIKHGCKLQAYKKAYDCSKQSEKTTKRASAKFFAMPKVKAVVAQVQAEAIRRANIQIEDAIQGSMETQIELAQEENLMAIDAEWVLKRAASLADFNISKFIRTDEHGNAIYDFSDASDEDWYCIQEYTVEEIGRGVGNDKYLVDRLKIKACDKLRALELVGKHVEVQAFRDNVDVNHSGEVKHRSLNDFYEDNPPSEEEGEKVGNAEPESST